MCNLPAPLLGLEFESGTPRKLWYQPPGFVIPLAWFLLFTCLGIARYYMLQAGSPHLQGYLFGLACLCATYAYYTLGLARVTGISALWFGFWGNILVILFALLVVWKILPLVRVSAYLTMPIVIWTLFATLIVLGEMRLQKLF